MNGVWKHLKEGVFTGALVVVVALCLPLIAILVFVGRMFFVAAAALCLMAGILGYVFSPRFREWFRDLTSPIITYKGLRLATDVALHPGHCWARIEPDEIVIGADDLVQAVLGPVDAVECPTPGSHVSKGERLLRLRHGGRSLDLLSPVSGRVVRTNSALLSHPGLVNTEPFTRGWLLRVRGDQPRVERRYLLRGGQAITWFRREVDRLIGAMSTGWSPLPTLADGGAVVGDLYQHIDDDAWQKIRLLFERTG